MEISDQSRGCCISWNIMISWSSLTSRWKFVKGEVALAYLKANKTCAIVFGRKPQCLPPQKCSKRRASWERYQGRRSFFFLMNWRLRLHIGIQVIETFSQHTSQNLGCSPTNSAHFWKMKGSPNLKNVVSSWHPYFWGAKTKTREFVKCFCPTHNPSNTEFPLHMFRLYWWSRWGTSKCLGNLGNFEREIHQSPSPREKSCFIHTHKKKKKP